MDAAAAVAAVIIDAVAGTVAGSWCALHTADRHFYAPTSIEGPTPQHLLLLLLPEPLLGAGAQQAAMLDLIRADKQFSYFRLSGFRQRARQGLSQAYNGPTVP